MANRYNATSATRGTDVDSLSGGAAPTTLAAQAQAFARARRGPLAALGTGATVGYSASATASASVPQIARGTSGVATLYSTQAGGYAAGYLLASQVWTVRGWILEVYGSDLVIVSAASSGTRYATLAGVVATTGWHSVAWSISSDGATVRASVDGGAAASQTITSGPLAFTARDAADDVWVLTDGASGGSLVPVGYLGLWSSVLSDADLAALSASPELGAPTLPSAPAWEWAAAAFSGADLVRIAGDSYARSATAPQIWMP